MRIRRTLTALTAAALAALLAIQQRAHTQSENPAKAPAQARAIPGLTSADPFTDGCVSCHTQRENVDGRISTILKRWETAVEPSFVARVQGSAPKGMTLKGKHPAVPFSFKDIPNACLTCHVRTSKIAPPMSQMTHLIHLIGGEKNHYLTEFQGDCTPCHKMSLATGKWTLPSGPEK